MASSLSKETPALVGNLDISMSKAKKVDKVLTSLLKRNDLFNAGLDDRSLSRRVRDLVLENIHRFPKAVRNKIDEDHKAVKLLSQHANHLQRHSRVKRKRAEGSRQQSPSVGFGNESFIAKKPQRTEALPIPATTMSTYMSKLHRLEGFMITASISSDSTPFSSCGLHDIHGQLPTDVSTLHALSLDKLMGIIEEDSPCPLNRSTLRVSAESEAAIANVPVRKDRHLCSVIRSALFSLESSSALRLVIDIALPELEPDALSADAALESESELELEHTLDSPLVPRFNLPDRSDGPPDIPDAAGTKIRPDTTVTPSINPAATLADNSSCDPVEMLPPATICIIPAEDRQMNQLREADEPADKELCPTTAQAILASSFQNTLNRCEQMKCLSMRKDFCTFFLLDPETVIDPMSSISIPGMQRHPYPYQLYAVFFMLVQDSSYATGGFICDEMGLGKTTTTITYFVVLAWIIENHDHVQKYPHLHLKRDDSDDNIIKCPSQDLFPIQCSCVPDGVIARRIHILRGAFLVVVTKPLLPIWIRQFSSVVGNGDANILRLKLFVGHGDCSALTQGGQIHSAAMQSMSAYGEKGGFETHGREAAAYHHRFFILTTPKSYDNHVKKHVLADGTPFVYRALIRDEFHQEKHKQSPTVVLFNKIIQNQLSAVNTFPTVWGLSGSPYDKPQDLIPWIELLRTEDWSNHSVLAKAKSTSLREWIKIVTSIMNSKSPLTHEKRSQLHQAARKFGALLEELVIRRTTDSLWFGQKMVTLPRNHHSNINCRIDPHHLDIIKSYEERCKKEMKDSYHKAITNWKHLPLAQQRCRPKPTMSENSFFQRSRLIRLMAVFPGLSKLIENGVKLTNDEVDANGWKEKPEKAPYIKHLDEMVKTSSKCDSIRYIISQMAADDKLVILAPCTAIALMLEHFLKREGENVISICSFMDIKDRDPAIEAFNNDIPIIWSDNTESPSPRILVSTVGVLGIGYTCVRAFRLILVTPEWLLSSEEQAFSRISRIGQDKETYTYRLVADEVQVEASILNRQKLRAEFSQMALEIEEGVMKQELILLDSDTA